MKQSSISILFTLIMSMLGVKTYAYDHDIEVENDDSITFYYNYINDGKELELVGGKGFSGDIIIPEKVNYMNRTRKVTSIGERAFYERRSLTSVTISNSVTSIGGGAFYGCSSLTSIIVPNSVKYIGKSTFEECTSLTSVILPNSVTLIDNWTFRGCSSLTSIIIPESVTTIGNGSFEECSSLTSVTIPNSVTSIGERAFFECMSLTSVTISNSVTSIGEETFYGCVSLTSITIPNSVKVIGINVFKYCRSLTSVTIPNGVTTIGSGAFENCSSLTTITIPNSVIFIGEDAFNNIVFDYVVSLIVNPSDITDDTFSLDVFKNVTLYVPAGTIDKYKATEGWKDFLFIEEGDGPNGGGGDTPEIKKCATPTISYQYGRLTFNCDTEGATCQYTITDNDIKSGSSNDVQLSVTYNISVFATKPGYDNSAIANATLCWIDVEPKTEGIVNGVASVRAAAVLIKSSESILTVLGADDGTPINVYSINGFQAGSAISRNGFASINTSLQSGSVAIVKVGEKIIKVLVK